MARKTTPAAVKHLTAATAIADSTMASALTDAGVNLPWAAANGTILIADKDFAAFARREAAYYGFIADSAAPAAVATAVEDIRTGYLRIETNTGAFTGTWWIVDGWA